MKKKYTDEQLIDAVKTCLCLQEVLNKLNLIGGHARIKQKIINLNLNIDHWKSFIGTTPRKIKPIQELLTTNSFIQSSDLKRRLFHNGYLENKCLICGISDWNNKPLSLQLDHINGIRTDNRIENLRLLCPNCHSQTDTFCGRNTKGIKKKKESDCIRYPCIKCGKLLIAYTNKLKMCSPCRRTEYGGKLTPERLKLFYVDYDSELFTLSQIGNMYEVSGTTIYNLLRRREK